MCIGLNLTFKSRLTKTAKFAPLSRKKVFTHNVSVNVSEVGQNSAVGPFASAESDALLSHRRWTEKCDNLTF